MDAVDTNILIYVHDPRDPQKQARAAELVRSLGEAVLLWQVACEYLANARKLAALGFDEARAWSVIGDLTTLWRPTQPSWAVLEKARKVMARRPVSFWDALLIAACDEAGVTRLYSEDFGDPAPAFDGVEIVNPFRKP